MVSPAKFTFPQIKFRERGRCFVKDLTIKNCRFVNTTLALEYSTVDADIAGGIVRAGSIGELIMEPDEADVTATKFELNGEK